MKPDSLGWLRSLLWLILLAFAVRALSGCAAKKPTKGFIAVFHNCTVTAKDPDGRALSCYCGKYTLATDAKTGQPAALCEGKK